MINLKEIDYKFEYALDLQGWDSYNKIFEKLIEEYKPKTIIEVGTWKGASAIHMANICKKNDLNSKIYCVDTWLGGIEHYRGEVEKNPDCDLNIKYGYPNLYYIFLSNVFITKNEDTIIPIPNTSLIGSKILEYNKIKADLIYIDGGHEYEDVYSDLKNYYPLLNDNGVIFGDDFDDFWIGVKNGVTDFCKNKNIPFEAKDRKWIIKK